MSVYECGPETVPMSHDVGVIKAVFTADGLN